MRALAAALALLGASAASAQTITGDSTQEQVNAWAQRVGLRTDGWELRAWSDRMAFYIAPDDITFSPAGHARFWVRSELYRPQETDDRSVLSYRTLTEFNCDDLSFKMLAEDQFSSRNLQGEKTAIDVAEARWEFPRPGTAASVLQTDVCEYVERLFEEVRAQDAAASPIRGRLPQ